jgi:hypothetical protein
VSPSGEGNRHRSHLEIHAIALAAAIVAVVSCWLVGEMTREVFKPRLVSTPFFGRVNIGPSTETQNIADSRNAVLAFAILGGVTGLALGFAGGLGARSFFRGAIVGVGGLALGSLVGALTSISMLPLLYRQLVPDPNDLLTPILFHGGISAAIGIVGGLAFSIGMGRGPHAARAMTGACLGALAGAIVFHLLSEFVFADSSSGRPVPSSSSARLLARFLVIVPTAFGAAWGAVDGLVRPVSSSPTQGD